VTQLHLDIPTATTDGNLTYAFIKRVADYVPSTLLIPATQDFWFERSDRPAPAHELEASYHRDFEARFGVEPDFGPGVAFDAVSVLADALGRNKGDATTLKETLEQSRGVIGVVGTYDFSSDNHRGLDIDDVAMVRVADGGFVPAEKR
jgi:branched-chain amino acid transport system substrate-binding protein